MDQAQLLHESLQELIGLHRQMYETVKLENEAITNADLKLTYDATATKEALIHWIHRAEIGRQAIVYTLAEEEKFATTAPSLRELILYFQTSAPDLSDKLQTDLTTLIVLVERIKKQNDSNKSLVEESLRHVNNMKRNIFGETTHQGKTYNQQGQRNPGSANSNGPRLISKEV
jgi:hypothetical protein